MTILFCITRTGMARRMYNSEYYSAKGISTTSGSLALPIRWMAPESYSDGTWDLRSDVWMFGVLLWGQCPDLIGFPLNIFIEIFSWGEKPWEGHGDMEVIRLIQNREKLSQPVDCPDRLYGGMLDCWKLDTTLRATASKTLVDCFQLISTRQMLNLRSRHWRSCHRQSSQRKFLAKDSSAL